MKVTICPPFFEVGVKNYIFGDTVLELALASDNAARKYDVDVIFTAPYVDIRRISENTSRLFVIAPHMDTLRPGRGLADVLPESLKAAGAKGVMMNHCERPMSLATLRRTIARANELGLFTLACADTLSEVKALAHLHPDSINPEPTELMGSVSTNDMEYVVSSIRAVKSIEPDILVEIAAGITNGEQVYNNIISGADGVGAASGIINAEDPLAMVDEMIYSVRRAYEDINRKKLGVV